MATSPKKLIGSKERKPAWALVRTQIRTEIGIRGMSEGLGLGKNPATAYLYLGLIGLGLVGAFATVYGLFSKMADLLVALNQPGLMVILSVTAAQFLVLFIGISGLMSIMYESKDLETLQAMPFSGKQIMAAKVTVSLIISTVVAAASGLPGIVALGVRMNSPRYWISTVVLLAGIPMIPTALALLAIVPLMKWTGKTKRRDMFRVVFGLLLFVLVIGFQVLHTRMLSDPDAVIGMLMEKNGLLKSFATYYLPLKWAASALTADNVLQGLANLGLFTAVSVGALGAAMSLTERWFLGGISREVRASAPKAGAKTKGAVAGTIVARQRSLLGAFVGREHKMLVRNTNWLLVTLTNLTIVPLMLVIFTLSAGKDQFNAVIKPLVDGVAPEVLVLAIAGAHAAVVSLNQVASTAFSREGATFSLSKTLPVPAKYQARAKLVYSIGFSLVQLAIMLGTVWFVLRPDATTLVLAAVLGILIAWPVSAICLMNDLLKPKLRWSNPQQAMKGNINGLVAMLFSLMYLGLLYLTVKAVYPAHVAGRSLYGVMTAIIVVTGLALQRALDALAGSRYKSIEI